MPIKKTTCPRDCYDACSMIVEVQNNKITKITGDKNHPVTNGFLCRRGYKDPIRLTTNRVKSPYLKLNENFTKISWNDALNIISEKIKNTINKHSASQILYLDYAGNEGLINNIFVKRLWHYLGTSFTDYSLCTLSGHKAINLHYGKAYGIQPTELPQQKLIIFWGFNPAVTSPHIWHLALKAKKFNHAKIIVIDPLKTTTAHKADLFFQIFPQTDVILALAISNYLINNNLVDYGFINKFTKGFKKYSQLIKTIDLNYASKITKLPINDIKNIAQLYAENKPSAIFLGVGLQKNRNGNATMRAISLLPALIGIHRGFFYSNSPALSVDLQLISGKIFSNSKLILNQTTLSDELKKHKTKLVFINSTNPVVTHPNAQNLKKLLNSKNIFTIVQETHWSETAKIADLVLPVNTFLEKEDIMLSWGHNFTQRSEKIINPIYNTKSELEIMIEIAKRLNIPKNSFVFDDPWDILKKAFNNAIENNIDTTKNPVIKLKIKPKDNYETPSKKIEFIPTLLPSKTSQIPKFKKIILDDNEFLLLSTSHPSYTNSQFTEVFGPLPPIIRISHQDAKKLKLKDKQTVNISNSNGTLTFKIKISNMVQPKILHIHKSTKDLNNKELNYITSRKKQHLGKSPAFQDTIVKITPL